MDAYDKIYFYANYDKLGELQTSKISEEVVCIQGEVSKVKNGLVFFTLENELETGIPKSNNISSLKPFSINSCFRELCGITK